MSGTTPRVLIGGGSGFVGTALRSLLQKKGYEVSTISRTASKGITWAQIEQQGLPPCHAVINVSGENILQFSKRWTDDFKKQVYDSRIKTNGILKSAIEKSSSPPKVFITASGVGFYPCHASDSPCYDESSAQGEGYLADLARDWEQSAKIEARGSHTRCVQVRLGVVLAAHGGAFAQMKLPFWLGVGGPIGSGQQMFPWIHIDDAAHVFAHCMEHDVIEGPVNAVSPVAATNLEYTRAIGAAMSRPTIIPTPGFAFRLLLGEERAKMLTEGQHVVPQRLLDTGFQHRFPDINAAMANIVAS